MNSASPKDPPSEDRRRGSGTPTLLRTVRRIQGPGAEAHLLPYVEKIKINKV
jgi:hypothetical protein